MNMRRARAKAAEMWERRLNAQNEAAERYIRRLRLACVIAHEHYGNSVLGDDLVVMNYDDEESFVESVDGGYWVEAKVWVDADAVEDRMIGMEGA